MSCREPVYRLKPLAFIDGVARTPFGKVTILRAGDDYGFYCFDQIMEYGYDSSEAAKADAEQWFKTKMLAGLEEVHPKETTR